MEQALKKAAKTVEVTTIESHPSNIHLNSSAASMPRNAIASTKEAAHGLSLATGSKFAPAINEGSEDEHHKKLSAGESTHPDTSPKVPRVNPNGAMTNGSGSSIESATSSGPPKVVITTTVSGETTGESVVAVAAAAASSAKSPLAIQPSTSPTERSTKSKGVALRRGKWTAEEEAYVARVIQDFNSGFLDAPAGTTLRSYLSDKLQCDPMRITKKFTGEACIGKRVFHPAVRSPANSAAIDKAQVSYLP
jgi:hypothetical protein